MEEKKTETTTTPRIYVASLADYNAGRLLGRWIDADQPSDDIYREIAEMLAESKEPIAEEWAIHDYENFGSLRLSEFEDLKYVSEVARLMGEHGTFFAELVGHCCDIEEAQRYMEEGYCGELDRLDDYAEQFVEECYGNEIEKLPVFIRYHIDFEGIARDMELSGDVFTIQHGGKVHVFNSNI
jgi:antirestriction protein